MSLLLRLRWSCGLVFTSLWPHLFPHGGFPFPLHPPSCCSPLFASLPKTPSLECSRAEKVEPTFYLRQAPGQLWIFFHMLGTHSSMFMNFLDNSADMSGHWKFPRISKQSQTWDASSLRLISWIGETKARGGAIISPRVNQTKQQNTWEDCGVAPHY